MADLPVVSGAEAVAAFRTVGYRHDRTKGSHMILIHDERATLSVPNHKELKKGTLRSLIRDAGMTVQEFIDALG